MTQEQKKAFLKELLESVQKDLEAKLPKVPDNWSGVELREWVKEHVSVQSSLSMSKSQRLSYHNDIMTLNLV